MGRRRLSLLVAIAAAVASPAVALAVTPPNHDISNAIAGRVTPELESAHSHGIFDVTPSNDLNRGGRSVRTVVVRLVHGFEVDRRAVGARCSTSQANRSACPSASRIGSGTAKATKNSSTINLKLDLFMGPGSGVVALIHGGGVRGTSTGSLTERHPSGHDFFDDQVSFGGLDQATGARLDDLHLELGAKRTTVRTQHGRRRHVTYHLLTNPSICPGGWQYEIELDYADGTRHTGDGSMSCTER